MNKWGLMGLVLIISLMAVFSTGSRTQPGQVIPPVVKDTVANTQVKIDKDYGKMPLAFIPNKGQMDRQVYFYLQGKDKSVYFTSTGLTYALAGPGENQPDAGNKVKAAFPNEQTELQGQPDQRVQWEQRERELSQSQSRWVVKLDFVNARKGAKPECLEKSGTVVSYFKGKTAEWQTGLEAAAKILYRELWPGIDLVYYGTVNKMKYEFIVHPGADPARIKLAYRGAESVVENRQGQLEVHTPMGSFSDDSPVAWQDIAGKRHNVALKYALEKKNPSNPQDAYIYGFSVGEYDRDETLVLDPVVIVYCGYIGHPGYDYGNQIAVDSSGCAYITGSTNASPYYFPMMVGPDLTYNEGGDAFVAKVNAAGTGLVYCGYIGGAGFDIGESIAADGSGCAYVTGYTNSSADTFPVAVGPDLTYNGGFNDAFIAKINAAGTGLVFCGYIGGSDADGGKGIVTDASGCAYIIGFTFSTETTFPAVGGPDLTQNGYADAFVAKVRADGSGLVYCGYIGGNYPDFGQGIAVDGSGCAYVTGDVSSNESTFPVSGGPDLTLSGGNYDAFVAKVNASGTSLVYCGYIGGSADDGGRRISVDALGCAYVGGETSSGEASFPVTVGPDLTYNGGDNDIFVAKINSTGTSLVYCGYIGGSGDDLNFGIAVDTTGCCYVTGQTNSTETTFPVTGEFDLTFNGGTSDAFLAKIQADGAGLDYCGYIGGAESDGSHGIAIDDAGFIYITGNTRSTETTFPVTVGPDLTYNNLADNGFVAKISSNGTYTVNFTAGSGGSLTGETTQTVVHGNDCSAVAAVPDTWYHFINWTGTGGFVTSTDNPLTVTNVTANMTITANFAVNAPIAIQLGAWNTTTPFNTPRMAHTSVVYNGYLYVLGGCDLNDTRLNDVQYAPIDADGSLGTWQVATPFNTGRRSHTSVAYNGYLYVLGGTPSGGGVLNDVQFAPINPDGSLGSWQSTTSFNTGRLVHSSVAYNGYLYVIQGFYYSAAAPLTDVQFAAIDADGTLGPWQNTTTFTPGRWGHQSTAYNQYLYTMGGGNWNGSYYTLGDAQYSSVNGDGTLNAWQGTTTLDPYRDAFGLVQYGGNLIMTGGINNSAYYHYVQYAATHADGTLGPWSRMTSFNTARASHTSVVHNGYLYVIGGTDNTGTTFSDVQYAKINELSEPTHAVTFAAGTGGTTSGCLYQVITEGGDCAPVTAVPGTGFGFVNWTGDGGFASTTDNPLTVTNVTADMTITANFGFISLTGQVIDSGTNGIANVRVVLYDTNFNQAGEAWTGGSGNYTFYDLTAGDYKLFFNGRSAGNFQDEWYNDKNNFDTADNVSITAGNTTTVNAELAEGGTISGRVTDAANNGIEGVSVQVCDLAQYWLYGNSTDSNGDYTITGVKTGSFKVEFRPDGLPGNYTRQWYNNQISFNSADAVAVTAGNTTANINAQLAAGGSISGRVTDTADNGIENVNINVCDANGSQVAWSATDNDGYYTVSVVPTGNQKVQFWPGSAGNYIPEWYDHQVSFEQADSLLVVAGQTTTGIDAQLAAGGAVSGRVTDASGTVGLANIEVQICDLNNYWYPGTNTDNDGYYTLWGLPNGNYKVEFRTHWDPGDYIGEWYNDKSSNEAADIVTVTVGETTTGIDAALAAGGSIGGRVTEATGTVGLANVDIQICDLNGNGYNGVSTNGEGYYTIHGLPAGSFKLYYNTRYIDAGSYVSEWYNHKNSFADADAVSVSVGQTTAGIDVQLAEGGYISGRVTNYSGKGVANVNANIYYYSGAFIQVWATTDSSGYYTVKGVPSGDYQVHFGTGDAGNYLDEWYNDKNLGGEADPVTVTAGNTTGGINAQLTTGGSISGKVMDSSLMGIANVTICVHDINGNWLNNNQTDEDGNYTVDRLPTGSYKIYFESRAAGNYIREWYNNQAYIENANPVAVTAGITTKNINAVLADGGAVSGSVTDSGNNGIADVYVGIVDMNHYWHQVARTDIDGNYTLIGLSAGDYKIQVQTQGTPGNYVSEWYNDRDSFENADTVTVFVNQTTTGIDAQLADGGAISGKVTDSTGTVGIANVNINVCDANQNWLHGVSTDNSGYYTLYGMPAGTYKIQFYAQHLGNYANEWWDNQRLYENAAEVTVTTGNTTENIDAQLEIVGSITGTVTAASTSDPLEGVRVYVYDLANNEMGNCRTGSDGNYSLGNLDPANYKVYFNTGDVPLYIEEWYNDKDSFANADEVTVNENAATTVAAALAQIQDDGYEPNDDFDHAAEITVGTYDNLVYLDPLQDGSERDWYKIYVGAEQAGKNLKVNLRVTSPYPEDPPSWWTSDLDFDILDGTGRVLAKALSSSDNETLYIVNLAEGWYYIDLTYCTVYYGPGGTGVHADYSMTAAVDTAANFGIGFISGRVTNELDQGIGGSPVLMGHNPYDWTVSFPIVLTDANGYYTIAYTPGDYTLQFNYHSPTMEPQAPNYISEYYNDKSLLAEAQVFSIHVGSAITGIDAVLAAGGTIAGTLTHSTGDPVVLPNQGRVYAFDKNSKVVIASAFNDTSGNYAIEYLPPGTYKIQFRGRNESWTWYAREWYDNQPSLGTGDDVVISTAGQVITGIDNQFSARGTIQGRVTNGNNDGVANVQIEVYSVLDPENIIFSGWTDGNGDYSVGQLPAGDMKIYFNAEAGGTPYVSEWYDNTGTFNEAGTVTVTSDQTTAGIDAQLSAKGVISGRVTDASGTNGIANVNVNVKDPDNNGISGTNTDENGYYTISGIPAGEYKLYFNTGGAAGNYLREWYNDKDSFENADVVTVSNGQTTGGIDAQLTEGGALAGRVTDASGTLGIVNVDVNVYDAACAWIGGCSTDSNGDYTIGRLPAGNYRIEFTTNNAAGDYVGEWYNDKTTFESADAVTVTAGQTTGGVDAQLADGGAISGRVTDLSGTTGIANVEVQICDLNQSWYNGTSTDSNGYYTLHGLKPGNYKIMFNTRYTPGNYVYEWYNDKYTFESADAVSVTAGQTTGGIDARLANGGGISGRITDESGTLGISNAWVAVYDLNNYQLINVGAAGDGYYTIYGLPAGTYKVQFNLHQPSAYVSEWYNDKSSFDNADTVVVSVGLITGGIDAQLATGGGVGGRVTDASGTVGIPYVNVQICDLSQNWYNGTSTDVNGYYTINGLPGGDYKIQFNTNSAPGNYIGEWYNDKNSFENADAITVTVGQTTTGIDAQLAAGGAVSGRVTDSSGTVGIANVRVRICDLSSNWYPGTDTGSDGYYTLHGLPAGDYKIEFRTNNTAGNYVGEWYDDKSSFDFADTVTVTVGQTTGGIDAQLAGGGGVSGRVTDASGTLGIAGVEVQICDLNRYWYPGVNTDGNGYYNLYGLPAGTYKIEFRTPWLPGNYVGEWYNDKSSFAVADTVIVTVGQTTAGIDAQLGSGGAISGRITDTSGTVGIYNVNVQICDMNQHWYNGVSTDYDGYYTIHGLPAGDFKIQFTTENTSGNYTGEWYNDKSSFENADAVTVTVGQTTGGIDAQLADGGGISGRVTDSSGTVGIANVNVQVRDVNNNWYPGTDTGSDGYYTIHGLASGDYKIEFRTNWTPGNYVGEWYNDKGSFDDADAVTVTVGQTTGGIDAQLANGGAVSGRVTDSSGTVGIYNVNIQICDMNQYWLPGVSTDSSGYYTIHGIPAGDYRIQFNTNNTAGNYLSEWYNDKDSFENADAIAVTVGQTTGGIDAQLADGGAVSGRVTDASGTLGLYNVNVQICDMNQYWLPGVSTDNSGYYTIHGLPAGDYRIRFNTNNTAGNYLGEWYNDKDSFENADAITVTVGQTTGGIDAQLAEGGIISGRVTNSSDSGIQNIDVQVYDLNYNWINSVRTGSNGDYTLSHLSPGSVKVYFETNQAGNYVAEWYNDKGSFDTADAITITAGVTQENIDAQLTDGGIISGRVSNEADEGIEGVRARILYPNGSFIKDTPTDTDGNYTVQRLAAGYYKVDFYPYNASGSYVREWYDNKSSVAAADLVEVTSGNTFTANAVLAAGGMVTGRVTNEQDSGIQGVRVQLKDLANINRWAVNTNANGDYTIKGITPGLYKVFFNTSNAAGNYLPEYYNDKILFNDSETLTVTNGETFSGIDAVLAPGCTISGTVTDEAANPLDLIDVYVFKTDGTGCGGTYTDANGNYQVKGLLPGAYKVWFYPYERNYFGVEDGYPAYTNYSIRWYNNKDNFVAADAVTTSLENPATGIDAVLTENGGGISGRITDSLGNGIANCSIALFKSEFDVDWYDSSYSDADGNYVVKGLPPGNWKLLVLAPGGTFYRREFYDDTPVIENATPVAVTAGQTTSGIDIVLDTGGLITGRVTDSNGTGIPNVLVRLVEPTLNKYLGWLGNGGRTDWNGNYSATARTGQWKVLFQTSDPSANAYLSEFYDDQSSVANAAVITVDPEQTVTGIDAVLAVGGGKISGYVKDTGNIGLGNAEINVYDTQYQNPVGYVFADANGYFESGGLIPGTYKVHASYNNYLPSEWYSDKTTFETAHIVTVTEGGNTVLNTIILGGSDPNPLGITGRVTDSAANGIPNVTVNLYDLNNTFIDSAITGSNGDYALPGMPSGDYKVYFDGSPAGNYLSQWYNNKGTFAEADNITVTTGVTLENIDAQLTEGGIISGQVTNESSEGIENVQVVVRDLNQGWIDSAGTDANGNYSIQRLPGSYYKVNFNTNSAVGMYVSEWYNDKFNFTNADPIEVSTGTTTPVHAVLEAGGKISGQIVDQAQAGIQGIRVQVKDLANLNLTTAITDANGNYTTAGLPVGDYKVYFRSYNGYISEWYVDKDSFKEGNIVSVTLGNTTAVEAELAFGSSISGTVTDASANPLEWVEVYVYDVNGVGFGGAYTDSSGHYQVNGLPAGNYNVNFYPWEMDHYAVEWYGLPRNYNYQYEWYDDQPSFTTAGIVPVTLETPATGIDAVLTENCGIIAGRITDGTGSGIAGCSVYAFQSTDDYDWYLSGTSDADGNYFIKGMPPGNYIVFFMQPAYSLYRRQFYNNTPYLEQAAPVVVTAGQTTSGIDAVLGNGGIITGRVTDSNGVGIGNVLVRPLDAATNKYLGWTTGNATTDPWGYYTIPVRAGTWKAMFETHNTYGGYRSEFYNDTTTVETAASFTVNPEQTVSGIDAVLSIGGGILSGYVKNPAGIGLVNAGLDIYDTQYNIAAASTSTDSTGYFEAPGLLPGNYTIYAKYNNIYPSEWYSDKTTYETADSILVTEGRTTPVTIILGGPNSNIPNLSGRVRNYAGTGLEYVQVNLYDSNQEFIVSVTTGANGDYAFYNIPAGDYKLYSDAAAAGNYISEWYQNTLSFEEAEPLTVTAEVPLEHIDVGLTAGGEIAGRITNESGQGIQGVRVVVRDRQQTLIATANSDASGNYSISRLVPDSYKVFFNTQNAVGLYVNEWYNDKENFNTADLVVVPAGETTTLDVTLAAGGAVSGTVTDGTLNPIENMLVDIYTTGGLYIANAYTDSSGHWLANGIPLGTYKVNFNPWELNYHGVDWYSLPRNYNYPVQWYNHKEGFVAADEAVVTVGNTTTAVDAVMNENEGGIISGCITDSSGSGISGAYACAFESIDNQLEWYYSEYYTGTGPDGNYEIKGLPTGNYIVLFFSRDSLYKRQFYDNTRDSDLATRVAVTAGQTTPGIDAVLEKGGVITGRVTDSKGNGLANVMIRMMDAATNKYLGFIGNNAQTDENGEYEVSVHPGQWKVMFQAYMMSVGGYVSEFYNDRSTVENAAVVTVAAGEPVPNIDAVLSTGGGKISGYVKDPANTGLRNAGVYVYDTQYKVFVGHTTTEGSGYFEVAGLIPGNYTVYTFYNDVYPSEWYSDKTSYETAKILTVTTGGNTYIEVVLGGADPVNPGQISITSPNGGESLSGGTIYPVTWTTSGSNPGEPVIIEYSLDNGATWIMITPSAANTGSYDWTVPAVNSGTCRLKITGGDGDAGLSAVSDGTFAIVSTVVPTIRLMSPKRWIQITAGTVQSITWTSTGNINQVVIEYSTDSGITWSTIAGSAPNTGSYQWAVPDTPSQYCRIRIRLGDGDSGSVPFDMTDTDFSIVTTTTPTLTVTSPNGGEAWRAGTAQTITWAKTGNVPNVKIEYSINGGGSWQPITASTANSGSYPWTVPDSPSDQCKIRVSDIDGNPTDMSNAVFSIEPLPTLTLTSPNGGETWEAGSTREITWTWAGARGDLKIEYSADGGTSWSAVTSSADDSGIYTWTVPDTPSENCLVRVSRNDTDEGPGDVSDGVFTIEAAPLLFVAAPNGGELWKAGDSYPITWTASNLEGNVVVDLYRGDSFDCNIGTASAGDGRIEWKIPENFTYADDYRVLVYKDHTEDYSDTAFAITDRTPNHPDFNNDGHVDLVWRNRVSGGNEVWYMKGIRRVGTGNLPPMPGLDWKLVASADFNRDGKVDLLWRRAADGQNLVWYMDGIILKGTAALPARPGVNWQIVGTGDFNGDGKADLVWRHAVNGRNQVWTLDGLTVTAKLELAPREDLAWCIAGTGDFNNDGKVDLLWRNVRTGSNELWYMDGIVRTGTMVVHNQPRLNWRVVSTGDFNRDGHPDILWSRSTDGKGMVWYMDGIVIIGFEHMEVRPDLNWKLVGTGGSQN